MAWRVEGPEWLLRVVVPADAEAARRIAPGLDRSVRQMALSAAAPGSGPVGVHLLQQVGRALGTSTG